MKQLGLKAAQRCENSEHGRCRCRCGGRLHGAKRGLDEDFFATLDPSDPHRATAPMEKQRRPPKPKPERPQMRLFEVFEEREEEQP